MLGAISDFTMNMVSIIRNIWFYPNAKANKKNDITIFIVLCVLSIIIGVCSFDGIFSILPVIITIIFTYSVWQDNNKVYRLLDLPMSIMWITYNTYCQSLFGIIAESILLILEIIAVIKIYQKK
ncbi:MAG: YgjV family protein [Bacilli bacterium]|nr:YgjV family protein [Bacilli bacterium]